MTITRPAPTVAFILSGCGYLDGAEIQEAVLALYFLHKHGIGVKAFAPDKPQHHVVDHLRGEPTSQERNVLTEAARIVRGEVCALAELDVAQVDALVMPGGYGVAKNLSSFAFDGPAASVDADLSRALNAALDARKPIVALCIAPAIVARVLQLRGDASTRLTLGSAESDAAALAAMGADAQRCTVEQSCVDEAHRVITAPAYMEAANTWGVGMGIERAIDTLAGWLRG